MLSGLPHTPRRSLLSNQIPSLRSTLSTYASLPTTNQGYYDDLALTHLLHGVCLRYVAYPDPEAIETDEEKAEVERMKHEAGFLPTGETTTTEEVVGRAALESLQWVVDNGTKIELDHQLVYCARQSLFLPSLVHRAVLAAPIIERFSPLRRLFHASYIDLELGKLYCCLGNRDEAKRQLDLVASGLSDLSIPFYSSCRELFLAEKLNPLTHLRAFIPFFVSGKPLEVNHAGRKGGKYSMQVSLRSRSQFSLQKGLGSSVVACRIIAEFDSHQERIRVGGFGERASVIGMYCIHLDNVACDLYFVAQRPSTRCRGTRRPFLLQNVPVFDGMIKHIRLLYCKTCTPRTWRHDDMCRSTNEIYSSLFSVSAASNLRPPPCPAQSY